jgi:hypothetical protein
MESSGAFRTRIPAFRARVIGIIPIIEGIRMRILTSVFMVLTLALMSGCSISKSSGSISDSISSPSESISDSSSGGDDEPEAAPEPEKPEDTASYEADVSQLALTYAKNGGEIGALRDAVGKLATARGITDWESDSNTSEAIGRGIGRGGMPETEFVKFSKQLYGGEDLSKESQLRRGYDEEAAAVAQSAQPPAS